MATKISGVYMIHCLKNNKYYIGSAGDIHLNWKRKRYSLNKGTFNNRSLQNDWVLHDSSSFRFDIIEDLGIFCSEKELLGRESYWQNLYESRKSERGYNVNDPVTNKSSGDGFNSRYIPENPIMCIHIATEQVVRYSNSTAVIKAIGISSKKVGDYTKYWIEKKGRCKSWKGYILVREVDYQEDFDYINYRHRKPARQKPEPKPFEQRDIKRCPVEAVNIATGEAQQFRSYIECINSLNLVRMKFYKCIGAEFGKYSHHGYRFRKLGPGV